MKTDNTFNFDQTCVLDIFAILFFLISVVIMGIGLVGEYLGRIFQSLSHRPRFVIREIIEKK